MTDTAIVDSTAPAAGARVVARFIEQMGLVAQMENLPRIAGRIFGLFLVEDGPLNLRAVAERLRVSRASVSTNARVLAQLGLLERWAEPGDRQDYYRLSSDPYRNLVTGMVRKMTLAYQTVAKAADDFPSEHTAKRRVEDLAHFYRISAETIAEISQRCSDAWNVAGSASGDLPTNRQGGD
jgi:DNA-binding transcriptional regulator GbsR (MarR family)